MLFKVRSQVLLFVRTPKYEIVNILFRVLLAVSGSGFVVQGDDLVRRLGVFQHDKDIAILHCLTHLLDTGLELLLRDEFLHRHQRLQLKYKLLL